MADVTAGKTGTGWRSRGGDRRSTRTLRLRTSAVLLMATVLAVLLVPPLVQLDQQAVDLAAKLEAPPAGPTRSAPTTSAATCCCAACTACASRCSSEWRPR
ncbi:hypothetical protein RKD48_001410 [Streptomyces ambofaciens]